MLDAKNTSLLKPIISYRELVILNYNLQLPLGAPLYEKAIARFLALFTYNF